MSARPRVTHETKAARTRRQLWIKAGVWIFILLFTFSVAGGILATRLVSR
ncbi:MAG: hypothetical protein KGN02_02430 [bacterium]|nr:hypothetical protein [bacterium]